MKLDGSFPNNQFVLVGYHLPYSLDITDKKRGLMVFVKSHISSGSHTHTIHIPLRILKFDLIYKSIYKASS